MLLWNPSQSTGSVRMHELRIRTCESDTLNKQGSGQARWGSVSTRACLMGTIYIPHHAMIKSERVTCKILMQYILRVRRYLLVFLNKYLNSLRFGDVMRGNGRVDMHLQSSSHIGDLEIASSTTFIRTSPEAGTGAIQNSAAICISELDGLQRIFGSPAR